MIDYTLDAACTNASAANCERWAHQNRLGSVIAVSDAAGAVIERYTYSAYGESGIEGDAGFPFRFTGQKLDAETGLYYYKARYYDPETGRFLQTDPVGYEDQMNLYAYVGNDPVNASDPAGESAKKQFFKTAAKNLRKKADARRIKNAKARGRRAALKKERQQLRDTGESPSNLSPDRQQELMETGNLKNMDGHHDPSASSGGSVDEKVGIAENPDNIKFKEKGDHQQIHSGAGGTQVPITGGHDAITVGLAGLAIAAEIVGSIPDPSSAFTDTMFGEGLGNGCLTDEEGTPVC